ncbi:MAG: lipopolysaccharide biosynthesis protein [Oceanicaulis sp.]
MLAGSQPRALKNLIGWALLGQGVYLLSQLGVLVGLARFATPEDVGRFGYAVAIASPIIALTHLGLRFNLTTDIQQQFSYSEYVHLRAITTLVAVVSIGLVGLIVASDQSSIVIIALVALMKAAESFSDLSYGAFQKHERPELVARSLILRGPLALVLFILLLWTTRRPDVAFFSQFLIWSVVAFAHDHAAATRLHEGGATPKRSPRSLFYLAVNSLPLGLSGSLSQLSGSAPKLIVGWTLGLTALGYYTAIAFVLQAGTIAIQQASQAFASRLARRHLAGDLKTVRRILVRSALVLSAAILLGILVSAAFGGFVLSILFGPEYENFDFLLIIFMVALLFRTFGIVLQASVISQRRFWLTLKIRVIIVISSFALAAMGAIYMDLIGVAASVMVIAILQVFLFLPFAASAKTPIAVER